MDRRAEWTAAAVVALALAAIAPLGLASGEAADQAAQALGVKKPFSAATPLADVVARVAVLLPVGEVGTRPHLVAALGGAAAMALLLARLRFLESALAVPVAVPVALAVASARGNVAWWIAAGAGMALVGVSRPFLEVATVRPGLAIDFALMSAIVLLLETIRRNFARSGAGLGLAFACGLATGAGWPVRAAAWPLALVATAWALRRGVRWPLLAPLVFVAGTGVTFGAVVGAAAAPVTTLGFLIRQTIFPSPGTTPAGQTAVLAIRLLSDDIGVLATLVAVVGSLVVVRRLRAAAISGLLFWALAVAASVHVGDVLLARLLVVGALAAPAAAAVLSLSNSFGRAQVAVAAATGVILLIPPAIVGFGAAAELPARRAPYAVARRLDAAVISPIAAPTARKTSPTDAAAARWRRYGSAVGVWPPDGP